MNGTRRLLATFAAVTTGGLLALSLVVTPAAGIAAAPPSTQAAVQAALDAARPGSMVIMATGTIDAQTLRVPAGVTLAGQDTNGDGRSDTVLRLPRGASGFADQDDARWASSYVVRLNGAGARLDMVVVDGNKAAQAPLRPRVRTEPAADAAPVPSTRVLAPVQVHCDGCSVTRSVVGNAIYDGIEVRDDDVTVSDTTVHTPGGTGIVLDGVGSTPVVGTRLTRVQVDRTGQWFPSVGWSAPGPGPGVGGDLVVGTVIDGLRATRTNGDGVSLYTNPASNHVTVSNSTFSGNLNHCVHLGGDFSVILGNTCSAPGNHGLFLRSNQRLALDKTTGGRIVANVVTSPRNIGVVVQGAASDTVVSKNTLTGGVYIALFTDIDAGALAVGGNTFTEGSGKTRCQIATAAITSRSITWSAASPNRFDDANATRTCADERQAVTR
jgi:hypothetical protein